MILHNKDIVTDIKHCIYLSLHAPYHGGDHLQVLLGPAQSLKVESALFAEWVTEKPLVKILKEPVKKQTCEHQNSHPH